MNANDDLTADEAERIHARGRGWPTDNGRPCGRAADDHSRRQQSHQNGDQTLHSLARLLNFGSAMAFIVPLTYSLHCASGTRPRTRRDPRIRDRHRPTVFIRPSPLIGIWSDSAQSTRTTQALISAASCIGMNGLAIIGVSPNIPLMIVGSTIGMFGWANVGRRWRSSRPTPPDRSAAGVAMTGVAAPGRRDRRDRRGVLRRDVSQFLVFVCRHRRDDPCPVRRVSSARTPTRTTWTCPATRSRSGRSSALRVRSAQVPRLW